MDNTFFRKATRDFIKLKAANDLSATYSYMFTYDLPLDGGKSPWHCSDIPYAFHNCAIVPYTNNGEETDRLEEQISGAYVAFARTGCPQTDTLPEWPACTGDDEACMILDNPCEVRHNHDTELLALHEKAEVLWRPNADGQIQH